MDLDKDLRIQQKDIWQAIYNRQDFGASVACNKILEIFTQSLKNKMNPTRLQNNGIKLTG
jgi:hypothetical protein